MFEVAPALPPSFPRIDGTSGDVDDIPVWDGTPFNVAYAIDVLYEPQVDKAAMLPP